MNEQKFLDESGVVHLYNKLSLQDYPNNEVLMAIISAIDETKANKDDIPNLSTYEFITVDDIDSICGASIVAASEVTF